MSIHHVKILILQLSTAYYIVELCQRSVSLFQVNFIQSDLRRFMQLSDEDLRIW